MNLWRNDCRDAAPAFTPVMARWICGRESKAVLLHDEQDTWWSDESGSRDDWPTHWMPLDQYKALEAAARAACKADGFDPDTGDQNGALGGSNVDLYRHSSLAAVEAYLTHREAHGAVMVPLEPTQAMSEIGASRGLWDERLVSKEIEAADVYRAMIAARPHIGGVS